MSKVKFDLNLRGLNEVMKGPEIQALMQASGERIKTDAENASNGGVFEAETKSGDRIATTFIRAKNWKAMHAILKDNVLNKALEAGKF